MYICHCVVTCSEGVGDQTKMTVGDRVVTNPVHSNGARWIVFPMPLHHLHGSVLKIAPAHLAVCGNTGRFVTDITKEEMLDPDMVKAWVFTSMCKDANILTNR